MITTITRIITLKLQYPYYYCEHINPACCYYYYHGFGPYPEDCHYYEHYKPFTESRMPIFTYAGGSIAFQALSFWVYTEFLQGSEEEEWYKMMLFATQITWIQTSFTALWAGFSGTDDNTRPFGLLWTLVNSQTYLLTTASWAGLAYAQYERHMD